MTKVWVVEVLAPTICGHKWEPDSVTMNKSIAKVIASRGQQRCSDVKLRVREYVRKEVK